MQTRVARLFAFFTLTVSACAQGTHSLASDLLAVRSSVTLRKWMRAHPQDVFEGYAAAMARRSAQGNPLADSPALCGVAMGIAATLTRQAYFAVPSASSLHLPAGNRPNPELLQQCVLSGVTIESDSESPAASLANLKDDLSRVLGTGRPFEPDLADPLYWIRGAISWQGESRWILVVNTQMNGLDAVAITAANRALLTREANAPVSKADLKQAEHFANVSGMPPPLIGRMQQVIAQLESEQSIGTEQLQQIALLLVQWVRVSRHLPPEQKAAGLYAADTVLGHVYIPARIDRETKQDVDKAIPKIKADLMAAGAHFWYDELGASYSYNHDWIQEALRTAPQSDAGKQAFLYVLDRAFDPAGCGEGFEDVINRAPAYLHQYSDPAIRAHILLAIGDAYRDRIAVANGANGDPSQDAARYQPHIQQNYLEALRYYREVITASADSEPALEALTEGWLLLAGVQPLNTRFVCIYD